MSRAIRRQVEGVEDVVEAAKLRDEWSRELLHDEGLSEERADSLAEGVDLLEDRYPEIMGLAVGEANDFARRQGKGKGREQKASKPAAASGGEKGASSSKRNTSLERAGTLLSRAEVGRRLRNSRSPGVRRYARSAYRQTGIPGATTGATNMLLSVLGVTVGLSLLYLLLTNAESSAPGRSAVAQIAGGVAGGVQRLILPVDPLRGAAGQPSKAQAQRSRSVIPTADNDVAGPIRPTSKRPNPRIHKPQP